MKFLDALIRVGSKPAPAAAAPARKTRELPYKKQEDVIKRLRSSRTQPKDEPLVFSRKPPKKKQNRPPENTLTLAQLQAQWQAEDIAEETPEHVAAPKPVPAPAPDIDRTKTRLIGFHDAHRTVLDPFGTAVPVEKTAQTRFPVGWLVVTNGPGLGASFTLLSGMSQIGRGTDQAVSLDFGDVAISRQNHAAIVFDPEQHTFLIGHGGKANVVRLNDKPLISNETLAHDDEIKIGETTLRLVVFATAKFNWSITPEAPDVAAS
jgi:hypothetical protein